MSIYGTYPTVIDTRCCQAAQWAFGMNSSLLCLANAMIISMIANPTTTIDVAHAQNATCKTFSICRLQSVVACSCTEQYADGTQGVFRLSLDHDTTTRT